MAATAPASTRQPAQQPPPPSDAVQIAMMLFAAAPVVGAVCSAPMVGFGLASLAIMDTLLILFRVNYSV